MRRRTIVPFALALVLVGGPSAVAAWRELPAYDVPAGRVATCLRSLGGGGLGVSQGWRSPTLLATTGNAIVPLGDTDFGPLSSCVEGGGATAANPPLLVGIRRAASGSARAPGRIFVADGTPAPTLLRDPRPVFATPPVVSVAPGGSGAAVVAWFELTPRGRTARLMATTRSEAGAPFAPPRRLATVRSFPSTPAVAIDDRGRARLLWLSWRERRDGHGDTILAYTADTVAGQAFGRVQRLPVDVSPIASPTLAVAPGGRALAAVPAIGGGVALLELNPGGERFAAAGTVDAEGDALALALRDDGAAALLVRDDGDDAVALARRPGGDSRFGPAEAVVVAARRPEEREVDTADGLFAYAVTDDDATSPALALADTGELVASWIEAPGNGLAAAAHVWRGKIDGGGRRVDGRRFAGRTTRLGSPCRPAASVRPLRLADGRLGVAWADNGTSAAELFGERPIGGGRVHVALPEPSAAVPAARPRLHARLLGPSRVGSGAALRIRVACGASDCDVRAIAAAAPYGGGRPMSSPSSGAIATVASVTVPAGASRVLRLQAPQQYSFAQPRRIARPRITLTACSPDGATVMTTTRRPRLRGRALPPAPQIVALRAAVKGPRVIVRWRLSRAPPRGAEFTVVTSDADGRIGDATGDVTRGRDGYRAVVRREGDRPAAEVTVTLATPVTANADVATVRLR